MRTQTLLKSIFDVAFIVVLLHTVPCDATSSPSALVGRWVEVYGKKDDIIELLSDGTGIFNRNAITWKTEKDRFYFTYLGVALSVNSVNCKLLGSELTFTDDNGYIKKYTKCGNKDCKEAAKEYVKAQLAKVKKGSFTDSRDGKSYKTVKLDNQIWLAENLSYNANGSKCYENQESNCLKYGKLYDWNAALSACPKGWHLPSAYEWVILNHLVGDIDLAGYIVAGNMLKASIGWNDNGNGIDVIGFAALPGGRGFSRDFGDVGDVGFWWNSTENDASLAYHQRIYYNDEVVSVNIDDKSGLFSVRCLQD